MSLLVGGRAFSFKPLVVKQMLSGLFSENFLNSKHRYHADLIECFADADACSLMRKLQLSKNTLF